MTSASRVYTTIHPTPPLTDLDLHRNTEKADPESTIKGTTGLDLAMASPETPKAPRCPELPELPADDFWSEAQWAVFMAIMDSVIPSIVPKSSMVDRQVQVGIPDAEYSGVVTRAKDVVVELSGEKALRAFLEDRPSASPEVRAAIIRLLVRLPVAHRNGLGKIMSSLA